MKVIKDMLIGCFSLIALVFLIGGLFSGGDEPSNEKVEEKASETKKKQK